jgi:2-amino-4-hydroxy-6-hydroxymethyldihydropteridine diphosphokinase
MNVPVPVPVPAISAGPARNPLAASTRTSTWGAMSGDVRRSYVVGLGANLGDRLGTLKSAVLALRAHGDVQAVSHLYESAAVGPPQPDYLNAAARLESLLAPSQLLRALLTIERAHGRERRERWGPRTLDLDLLYSPSLLLNGPDLTLPHPELTRRAFALTPLLDLIPDALDPHSGARYADLLAALGEQGLRRLETALSWDPRPNRSLAPGRAE